MNGAGATSETVQLGKYVISPRTSRIQHMNQVPLSEPATRNRLLEKTLFKKLPPLEKKLRKEWSRRPTNRVAPPTGPIRSAKVSDNLIGHAK